MNIVKNTDGTYAVTYVIQVKNIGAVALTNVQVTDNLVNVFGTSTYQVTSVSSSEFSVNTSYNGGSAVDLLAGTDGLSVGSTGSITLQITLTPNMYYGPYVNSAVGAANGLSGFGTTSDSSASGNVVDINANGIANELSENDPTIFSIEKPIVNIFVPAGFSPNGDGINSTYVIEGVPVGIKIALTVYNRWGNIVYEAADYQNDWNGIATKGVIIGSALPDGTYYALVELSDGSYTRVSMLTIKR